MANRILCILLLLQATRAQLLWNAPQFDPFDPDFGRQLQQSIASQVSGALAVANRQLEDGLRRMDGQLAVLRMQQGVGGVTLVRVKDSEVLIRDSKRTLCHGGVVPSGAAVRCAGREDPLPETFPCLPRSYVRSNDFVCVADGNVAITCQNGNCKCVAGRTYTLDELRRECSPRPGRWYASYDYYPDPARPDHVPITADTACETRGAGRCSWHSPDPWA